MRSENDEAHANDHTNAERQSDYPTHDWRNIASGTFHDLFDRSWAQNIIGGLAILLIAPLIGFLLMSNLRGMLIGAGIGLTILFWIMWGTLIKHATPIRKSDETLTPTRSFTPAIVPFTPASVPPTPPPTPTPVVTVPTPEKVPPKPTPFLSPSSSETNLTPTQIFEKIDSTSAFFRDGVKNAFVGLSVDWTLFFASARQSGGTMLIILRDKTKNEYDSGKLVLCSVPLEGNERFPLMDETDRFRVRGTIEKVEILSINLKNVSIEKVQ